MCMLGEVASMFMRRCINVMCLLGNAATRRCINVMYLLGDVALKLMQHCLNGMCLLSTTAVFTLDVQVFTSLSYVSLNLNKPILLI